MKSSVIALAAFAATIGTSASAQTYDAFRDFNGAQSAGDSGPGADPQRFIYGTINTAGGDGMLFLSGSASGCSIPGAVSCLQTAYEGPGDNDNLPLFSKSVTPSDFSTISVPAIGCSRTRCRLAPDRGRVRGPHGRRIPLHGDLQRPR